MPGSPYTDRILEAFLNSQCCDAPEVSSQEERLNARYIFWGWEWGDVSVVRTFAV